MENIETPALVVDIDALERNIAKMARFFRDRKVRLRPHFKTHKCPRIARMQIEAGAGGITCAKLGEAEVLVQAGFGDVLIANQVVDPPKIARIAELAREAKITVAVDNAENVDELAKAAEKTGVTIHLLVEVDVGMNRCGVEGAEETLALARRISASKSVVFEGLQAYEGQLVLNPELQQRREGVGRMVRKINSIKEQLAKNGIAIKEISGGGTGTYNLTGSDTPWTEIQAGSYVFMDLKYNQLGLEFENALTLLAMVIHKRPGAAVTDAGMKVCSVEFGLPQIKAAPGVSVRSLSEEHGNLVDDDDWLRYRQKIEYLPSHSCTTVNLHDRLFCVRDGILEEIWEISGRGKSR